MFCKMKSFKIVFAVLFVALLVAIMCIGAHAVPNIASAEDTPAPSAVTEEIYWGLVDNKLIISAEEITGVSEGGTVGSDGKNAQSGDIGWIDFKSSITNVEVRAGVTPTSITHWFYDLSKCVEIDLTGLDTSQVTNMGEMFRECRSLPSLDVSSLDTSNVTDMQYMFNGCNTLTSIDLSSFNTQKVANMYGMFMACSSLTSLDISSFDTSLVRDISAMFYGCGELTSLNLSGINTSNVANMSNLFCGCSSLTSLDVSSFDTSKVQNMYSMFEGCTGLTSLNLSGFRTSNVENMYSMFEDCAGLTSLNLSSFNTSKVDDMHRMFRGCTALQSLDLSNFDTALVVNMKQMFRDCTNLKTLDLSSFMITARANMDTDDMFRDCDSLNTLVCPAEILTDFELPNIFWDGSGDITTATSAQAGKTLRAHATHTLVPLARKEATCTEDGHIAHDKCEICDKIFIENVETPEQNLIISALGHDYSAGFTTDVAPTCTTAGSKSKHCSRCDSQAEVTEISALGHDYGEWTVHKEATANEDGEARRVCSHDSAHFETRTIPKLQTALKDSPALLALVIILAIIVAGEVVYLIFRTVKKRSQAEKKAKG